MDINIVELVVIIILACLAWYANENLNSVPVLKKVVSVLIVVISVLMLLNSLGVMGNRMNIRVNG